MFHLRFFSFISILDGKTLFNKVLDIFSSCRSLEDDQDSRDHSNDYLRLCYSIIVFLNENTVERNNIADFHAFRCTCWKEVSLIKL